MSFAGGAFLTKVPQASIARHHVCCHANGVFPSRLDCRSEIYLPNHASPAEVKQFTTNLGRVNPLRLEPLFPSLTNARFRMVSMPPMEMTFNSHYLFDGQP
jgi:hypothetical protein